MRARIASVCIALLVAGAVAAPAGAGGLNNAKAGLNGLVAWPADIAMGPVDPPEQFEDLPGAVVTAPVLGFFTGTSLGIYRLTMAGVDLAFTPFWVFPTLSPEPRFEMIKDVEYDE